MAAGGKRTLGPRPSDRPPGEADMGVRDRPGDAKGKPRLPCTGRPAAGKRLITELSMLPVGEGGER